MTQNRISAVNYTLLLVLITGLLALHGTKFSSVEIPRKDRLYYADYIYNLSTYGVFGLSFGKTQIAAQRGFSNGPLYMALMSSVVDEKTKESLACFLERAPPGSIFNDAFDPDRSAGKLENCPHHLDPLISLNYILAGLSLFLTGLIAFQIVGRTSYLYLAPLFAFLSFELTEYAQRIVVTNLAVPLFLLVQLNLLKWLNKPRIYYAILVGACLGLLTLTRPEYLYLFVFVGVCFCYQAYRYREYRTSILPVLLAFALVVSPWLWRNHEIFSRWQLIDNEYGAVVLAHRIAYNDMTIPEWLVSFVYWFPDVGDSIAQKFLPEALTRRHINDADDDSYYQIGQRLDKESMKTGRPTLWLLEQAITQPVMHGLTTLSFAWRGLFVGKWWALGGLVGYVLLLRREIKLKRYGLLWISALPVFMLLLRAGVSLNVTRYNMPLIPLYAMGWVYLILPRSTIKKQ